MINASNSDIAVVSNTAAGELYLTFTPASQSDIATQTTDIYQRIKQTLLDSHAHIFAERIFASASAMPVIENIRSQTLGKFDDNVQPTKVIVEPGAAGQFTGVQIHAVTGHTSITPVGCWNVDKQLRGRVLDIGPDRWVTFSQIDGWPDQSEREQARRMFECTGCMLGQVGADMHCVARTWLWLGDVCKWYDDLNDVRTAYFKRTGLIKDGQPPRLPASTGIGLGCSSKAACSLDLLALPGREDEITFIYGSSDQHSAFEYGSAFSRAAIVPMPGGNCLFISGTAAINTQGQTEHVGQIETQIDDTIQHIRALLGDANCTDQHVLSALVYCKTPEVEQVFLEKYRDLCWPRITMITDVCRDDLLFEIELVAGPVTQEESKGSQI